MMRRGWYPPERRAINLDADWFYRRLAPATIQLIGGWVTALDRRVRKRAVGWVFETVRTLGRSVGPSGGLSRHYPTGFMVLWVSVLLAAYLLFYLLG
jgi:multicomponent Na+:H+ antiporter subunit D